MIDDATDSNTVAKTYTWGLDLSGDLQGAGGVGGLLSTTEVTENTEETYYPSYDANGNVSEYVDDTDSVVAHYEYSPFGKLTSSSGSKASDFNHRFSTKYHDTETALYYYGYRYYSSELGRWLNRDPIEEEGGVNLYLMTHNSPVNLFDFLGMENIGLDEMIAREMFGDLAVGAAQSWWKGVEMIREGVNTKVDNLSEVVRDPFGKKQSSTLGNEAYKHAYDKIINALNLGKRLKNSLKNNFRGQTRNASDCGLGVEKSDVKTRWTTGYEASAKTTVSIRRNGFKKKVGTVGLSLEVYLSMILSKSWCCYCKEDKLYSKLHAIEANSISIESSEWKGSGRVMGIDAPMPKLKLPTAKLQIPGKVRVEFDTPCN